MATIRTRRFGPEARNTRELDLGTRAVHRDQHNVLQGRTVDHSGHGSVQLGGMSNSVQASARTALANKKKALGLCLIFATAGIWIVTSFISGSLVSSTDSHAAAVHPFLLTYLATSLFTLYLPLIHLTAWVKELLAAHRRKHNHVDR